MSTAPRNSFRERLYRHHRVRQPRRQLVGHFEDRLFAFDREDVLLSPISSFGSLSRVHLNENLRDSDRDQILFVQCVLDSLGSVLTSHPLADQQSFLASQFSASLFVAEKGAHCQR